MAANAQNQVWTDIVTARPSGYAVDANGDVEISSAEGLAWLISVVNGLNGCEPYDFDGHTVSLVSDVDLGGNVYGGSYCGGVAGWGDDGSVIDNCHINMTVGSDFYPGGVVGRNRNSTVSNCYARLVEHIGNEGAIVGQNDGGEVSNCYYNSGYDIPVIGNGDMTSVDCSRFFINENVGAVLQTPVSIGENVIDNLLDALNAWVPVQTSPTLYNEWCESSELLPFFCYLIFADVDESYVSENAVNVYPNPASGSISVSVNSGAEIEVYHLGASLKDLGKKWFAFSTLNFQKEEIVGKLE